MQKIKLKCTIGFIYAMYLLFMNQGLIFSSMSFFSVLIFPIFFFLLFFVSLLLYLSELQKIKVMNSNESWPGMCKDRTWMEKKRNWRRVKTWMMCCRRNLPRKNDHHGSVAIITFDVYGFLWSNLPRLFILGILCLLKMLLEGFNLFNTEGVYCFFRKYCYITLTTLGNLLCYKKSWRVMLPVFKFCERRKYVGHYPDYLFRFKMNNLTRK